jgi:hypothetical protein
VLARNIGGDVDVPDHRNLAIGPREPEGDHIGRARTAEVLPVQHGHRPTTQERDRDQGVLDALCLKHGANDAHDPRAAEGSAHSISRNVDGERHVAENSAVTPPPAAG